MPTRQTAFCQTVFDDPRADAIPGEDVGADDWEFRFGRMLDFTWIADEEEASRHQDSGKVVAWRYGQLVTPPASPLGGQPPPYLAYQTEYVPQLRALCPKAYCAYLGMGSGSWTRERGSITFTRWQGTSRATSALFNGQVRDLGAQTFEQYWDAALVSAADFPADPAFELNLLRWEPPPASSTDGNGVTWLRNEPATVVVTLLGKDFLTDTTWRLVLPHPQATEGLHQPLLQRKGPLPWDTWQLGKVFETRNTTRRMQENGPVQQVVRWQCWDGLFLLWIDGSPFLGYWFDNDGTFLPLDIQAGKVKVEVYGHQVMAHLDRLRWPLVATAELAQAVPIDWNGACHEWPPSNAFGPGGVARELDGTGNNVSIDWQAEVAGRTVQPLVQFTSAGNPYRMPAALYRAQCVWVPQFTAGAHAAGFPWASQDKGLAVSAQGVVTDTWQDAWARTRFDLGQGESMPTLQGDNKVTVVVGYQFSDDSTESATVHTGYVDEGGGQETAIDLASPAEWEVTVSSRDGASRLDRRTCAGLGSFAGWGFCDAFRMLAYTGGFAEAQLDLTAMTAGVLAGLKNGGVIQQRQADPVLQFTDESTIRHALSMLCAEVSHGTNVVRWGFGLTGKLTASLKPAYTAPTAWTDVGYWDLSETATDGWETIRETFRHVLCSTDAANWVAIVSGRRGEETWTILVDKGSVFDATADLFIGSLWQEFRRLPDSTEVNDLAQQVLDDRTRRRSKIEFATRFHYGCNWPDHFIRVNVTGVGITPNAVFQVNSKAWQVDGRARSASEHVEARQLYNYWQLLGEYVEVIAA